MPPAQSTPSQAESEGPTLSRRGFALSAVALAFHLPPLAAQQRPAARPPAGGDARWRAGVGTYRFDVGEMRALAVSDGTLTFPAKWYAVNGPDAQIESTLHAHFLPRREVTNQTTNLVVDTGRRLVLIDTGLAHGMKPLLGQLAPQVQPLGRTVEHMRAAGVDPEDITDVILTHGHPDHVGGLLDETGGLQYPNARFHMSRADYEYWTRAPIPTGQEANFSVARRVLPAIRDRVALAEPGQELITGFTYLAAGGHTPGHMALLIHSGRSQLLHCCDAAAHHVLALRHPDWNFVADYDRTQAIRSRRRLFDQAATDRTLVFASHFPWPNLGHVRRRSGGAWEWVPAVYSWEPRNV